MLRLLRIVSPGRLLFVVALLAAGFFLLTAGHNYANSSRLAANETDLRRQIDDLHSREERLTQIRDYLRNDDYIEYMARRVFGLVKPGETLVIVDSPEGPPADARRHGLAWWEYIFGSTRR